MSEPENLDEFSIKQLSRAEAAALQEILPVNECLKWDVAFRQFWEKRGMPLNPKGFNHLAFGTQGRDKKDNFKEEDEDYIDSLTRTE